MAFKKKYGLDGKTVIMYSGNIGLYYDLENLIKVIGKFKDRKDVVFAFIGEGTVKQILVDYVEEHNLENVKFIPYQPKEDLIYSLKRKYGNNILEILNYKEEIEKEIQHIENLDEYNQKLKKELKQIKEKMTKDTF